MSPGATTHREHTVPTPKQRLGAQTHREGVVSSLPLGDPPKRMNPLRTDVLQREGIPLHKLKAKARVCDILAG